MATPAGWTSRSSATAPAIAAVPGAATRSTIDRRGPTSTAHTTKRVAIQEKKKKQLSPTDRGIKLRTARDARAGPHPQGHDGEHPVGLVDPQAKPPGKPRHLDGRPLPASDHGLDSAGPRELPDGTRLGCPTESGRSSIHFDRKGNGAWNGVAVQNGTLLAA